MKAFLAWVEKQAKKFGVHEVNQEVTFVGGIGLLLSGRHLVGVISGPFNNVGTPLGVVERAAALSQLEFVGLLVCTALLGAAMFALMLLVARWVSDLSS